MTKRLIIALAIMLVLCTGVLCACDFLFHTHTFEQGYSGKDETGHWHKATCEHTDEISGKEAHTFEDGACTVCGYVEGSGAHTHTFEQGFSGKDETHHWHVATCEHEDEISGKVAHTYQNGMCSVCEYAHQNHSYENGTCTVCGHVEGTELPKTVTVTLNYDGATGGNTQQTITVTVGEKVGNLPAPTKDGYEFLGWYMNGNKVESTTIWSTDSNTSLVAKWKIILAATEGLAYKLDSDMQSYTVTGMGTATSTDIVIPETYNGKPVKYIAESAFSGYGITSVTIPDSVTSIGSSAFSGCNKLANVIFAKNSQLQSIGLWAFSGCSSLTRIIIPDSIKSIEKGTFLNCTSLTNITGIDNITSIGESAFKGCSNFTSISIPDDVTSIGNYAFRSCDNLETVYWNATNCTNAGSTDNPIFKDCSKLTNVVIDTNVMSIPNCAFFECSNIISATMPTSAISSIPKDKLETVVLTSGESIGEKAFYNYSFLKNVTIDSCVTSIGKGAFEGCSSLESITLPFVGRSATATETNYDTVLGYIFGYTTSSNSSAIRGTTNQYTSGSYPNYTYYFYYIPTSLKSVTITGGEILYNAFKNCSNLTGITIPDSVTSIGSSAFEGCSGLTRITIPDSVTSIGSSAFEGCSGLTRITIPDSVTSIGSSAFEGCSGLTNITIPDGITSISYAAFRGCSGLTNITISDSVTSIGEYAFYNCSKITNVTLGNGITSIGKAAFYNCSNLNKVNYLGDVASWCGISFGSYDANPLFYAHNLYLNDVLVTELVIPDGVTAIKDSAFSGCNSLTNITIPDSVTSIGSSAFESCSSLKYNIYNDALYLGNDNNPYLVLVEGTSKTSSINERTKLICNSAFKNCSSLTSITIPDSVTSIGHYAFQSCSSLTSVTIGNGVTSIGDYAFLYCSGLESITIPDSVTSIGAHAFDSCEGLTSVTIGNGVTSIEEGTFRKCWHLKNITIPDSVKNIGYEAFYNCSGLTSITIPDSVTRISTSAFQHCNKLESITLPFVGGSANATEPNYNTVFGYIFGYTTTTSDYESGATYQYRSSKYYHYYIPLSLKSVTITGGEILDYAFNNCGSLTSITIPDSVTSIGYRAFENCNSLQYNEYDDAIYLGNKNNPYVVLVKLTNRNIVDYSVSEKTKVIYDEAFESCSSLTSVTIPNGVTSIGVYAFRYCSSLTSITIPDSVTNIDNRAFSGCSGLTSITIPDSVTSIGESAFESCSSLNKVNYLGEIAAWCGIEFGSYDANPLYYARNLYFNDELVTELVIPEGVTSIGSCAFYNCRGLTSVTIPDSVTSIGSSAFSGCSSLQYNEYDNALYLGNESNPYIVLVKAINKNITSCNINKNTKFISSSAFYDCNSLTSITIPDSVTSIGGSAFNGCSSLTSVTIGNSVTSIGYRAFYYCSSLTSVTIPDSVTSIDGSAFYGCSNLASVTLGDGVTSIGDYAFEYCRSLKTVYYNGTVEDWAKINIGSDNNYLTSATRYYYSETEPTTSGNYWHYVDGKPVVWVKEQ